MEVARRLSTCVRELDTVPYLVVDEFVVMLSELGADKARFTAQAPAVAGKIHVQSCQLTVA